MSNCPNCGKPLIVSGGKCVNCGSSLQGRISQVNNKKGERGFIAGKESVWLMLSRFVLLALLVVEAVPISIAEIGGDNGIWWGIAAVYFNLCFLLCATEATIIANRSGFSKDDPFLLYFIWLHFIAEAIWILVGYFVFCYSKEIWMLITYLILSFGFSMPLFVKYSPIIDSIAETEPK